MAWSPKRKPVFDMRLGKELPIFENSEWRFYKPRGRPGIFVHNIATGVTVHMAGDEAAQAIVLTPEEGDEVKPKVVSRPVLHIAYTIS